MNIMRVKMVQIDCRTKLAKNSKIKCFRAYQNMLKDVTDTDVFFKTILSFKGCDSLRSVRWVCSEPPLLKRLS